MKCDNKARHTSMDNAKRHLNSLVESGKEDLNTVGVYCCFQCHFWHIGRLREPTVMRNLRQRERGHQRGNN